MTDTVNVAEAKAKLSELLARVEAGEEFTIARAGKPIARLIAAPAVETPLRKAGMWKHLFPADWNPKDALDEEDPAFWGEDAEAAPTRKKR
jgi:prevent-host-death family protein